jgi:hypothetical protein
MKEMPMKGAIRVSRRKMRALCAEGIDIQVNTTLGCRIMLEPLRPVREERLGD